MSLPTAEAALDAFDVLYFVAEDGRLTEWNAATETATGGVALANRPVTALFDGDNADAVERAIDRATERATASGDVTVEATLAGDGGAYEFEIARLDDGRTAVLGRDISERCRQRRELEARERVLRRMHEIIADSGRSFDQQVRALLALTREELGLAAGSLSHASDGEVCFEIVEGDAPISEGESMPIDETFCDLVVSEEETMVLNDVPPESAVVDRLAHAERGIACYLGAPVFVDEAVYGSLCFYDTESGSTEITPWGVALVDVMSRWVSHELERCRDHERLRRQNEKLDHFAAIASHDLRNPLNVLEGSLELAAETGEAEHFERSRRAIDRMESLIDDLLLLARAGDAIDALEPVALGELARESWAGVDTGTATLRVETDRTVRADRARLRQLFENLFHNAVEHGSSRAVPGDAPERGAPEGEPVTVTVGAVDADGFYIADDGVGIPRADREQVFESGFTTRSDGTGFGLSIVAEIAEAHGWTVDLDESEAGGARFVFTGVEIVDDES